MNSNSAKMSRDNTNSNGVYKTPAVRIGAGLSRSKLITGGTSATKPPSIKLSSALTSPTRVNSSGSGLTPVSRAHSERYQSAYTRFETLRNASFPALSDGDISEKAGTDGESLKTTRTDKQEKNESAKRASFPAFTSPVIGSSLTYIESQGQLGSNRSSGSLKYQTHEYTDSPRGTNGEPDRRGETGSEELDIPVKGEVKHEPDTKTPTRNTQIKHSSEVKELTSSPYDIPTKTADVSSVHKSITDTSDQSDQVQNYVVPPRRRHANKSKPSPEPSKESKDMDKGVDTDCVKPVIGVGDGLFDIVNTGGRNTSVSETVVVDRAVVERENDVDSTPTPLIRTRRRLTQRKISFKRLEDDEYIGFASLPEQVHRKAVRRGFEFTLMVVGETGLGKSTLINSLFLTDLYKDRKVGKIEERVQKTVELEKKELEIEERGVKLKLTIVDTPGFNDAVNAEESWKPIVNYIDKQFESYFKAESGLNRKNIHDSRVHCCLYFISPYGHGLRPVDVLVMKKLHHKVNIVPLVAKSDMLTKREIKALKEKVLTEIQKHKIQIYQFPDCDSDEDEDFKQQDQELKKAIPFAVVGSNTVVEAGGKKIRGRMYPWGIVEVENPSHCDFVKLRQMLISTHMQDLKDVTCDVHYENYRAEHISEQMTGTQRERGKLKRESVTNMDKVMDTERLLQEKEAEIKRMQEMLAKMQTQLNQNSPKQNGKVAAV